jgi:hypothetical protein
VADDLDSYPDCTSNNVDNCGECDGNNSTCTGCEDEVACNTGDENDCVYASTWYADTDGDELGDPAVSESACTAPEGYVADNTDTEPECATNDRDDCGVCAGGNADDLGCGCFNDAALTYYADTDEDGLGDPAVSESACIAPDGYVADNTDAEPNCGTNDVATCGECGCLSIDIPYVNT